jgi:demethylmenaquinone methyltransferase/2-methoxy-6-polyprenyl-1,4-benzoquinol methylase
LAALCRKAGALRPGDKALDVASGTGDLAFELAKRVGNKGRVVGLDIAREMVVLGHAKSVARADRIVDHHRGDGMHLPYADGAFRAVTMAFGGRNVLDLTGAFREMGRVLGPGGRLVHLELNRPRLWGFRHVFDWYFHTFSPLVGGLISATLGTNTAALRRQLRRCGRHRRSFWSTPAWSGSRSIRSCSAWRSSTRR